MLCETFVDPTRHDSASYRAANWEKVGMTAGHRGGSRSKPPKEILVMPLDPDFRRVLKGGSRPPKRRKPTPLPVCDDPFVAMWMKIIEAAGRLAAEHDRTWMRRRRVLNSLIVMLFVFRLVLSRNSKGYATVVAELWDQCRKLRIDLPQRQPVVASSICKARARVHEDLFLDLHREILRHGGDGGRWKGHRTFAIDGTKMNLPRPLADAGYPLPNANAHYPQGLVSCLYRLETKTPVDFSLSANADERAAALAHLDALSPGDVVVVDRGYFSFVLLHAMVSRGLHPVFRLQRNSTAVFDDFIDGGRDDALVRVVPKVGTLRKLRAAFPGKQLDPVQLRLVKLTAGEDQCTLATTLTDQDRYTRDDLSGLYHGRWGIEELYKTSKIIVPWTDRTGRSPGTVRPLQPDRHDAATVQSRRRAAGGTARGGPGKPNDELQERARDDGGEPGGAGAGPGGGTGRDHCLDGGADPWSTEPAAARAVISAAIDEAPQQVDPKAAHGGLTQQNSVRRR